ncbi:MAG: 3'-phosphoesterase [Candidatus Altiarchaeales archaeon]|nr:3'-phosphoesterase [Candidatus Altiarchaeales archaeon]
MALEEYKRKRDFGKTSEPEGAVKDTGKSVYVIQKHQASHLHWDLRLEFDGVLKSWAVPKEPPVKEGEKRLAVETEDHPIDYASFQGQIPEGEYGAGKVEIWDKGNFKLIERTADKILIEINGKRLSGQYYLVKFPKIGPKNWLFFKKKT